MGKAVSKPARLLHNHWCRYLHLHQRDGMHQAIVSAPAQRSKCTFTNNAVSIGYLFNLDNFPNSGTCSYPTSIILCS